MDEMGRDFWDDSFKENPDHVNVEDVLLDAKLEGLQPGSALDLGCGSGPNVLKLARLGWSAVGVDWAETAVKLANWAAREEGLDATFIASDITEWQPPGRFDPVISTYALPGGEASRRALGTALDALAEGGTLMVAEWDRSMAEVWHFEEDDLMTPEQIAALLPGLEIEVAEVRRIENAFGAPDDPRGYAGPAANVAFVRARKP